MARPVRHGRRGRGGIGGLIFVAVSLNHEQILAAPALPPLAAQTLSVLVGNVLLSIIGLTPEQATTALSVEVLAIGLGLTLIVFVTTIRQPVTRRPS